MRAETDGQVPPIESLMQAVQGPFGVGMLAVLALCCALAWGSVRILERRVLRAWGAHVAGSVAHDWLRRVAAPALAWMLLTCAHAVLAPWWPVSPLAVAQALLGAMALIRAVLLILRQTMPNLTWLAGIERMVAALVWGLVALHVLGLLPTLLDTLDAWVLPLGKTRLSVLQLLTGLVTVVLASILAMWLSRALDARLRAAPGLPAGARAVLARLVQPVALVLVLLIVLPLVGVDLTTLSVFGGALGVGLGLGMQKIAANYVAGFMILLDESIAPGRLIRVDRYRGVVSDIRARYTVLRGADGIDAIVPNEMLVSAVVESETFGSTATRIALQVGVSYESDVERALAVLLNVARAHPRVLSEPAPASFLVAFGDSAILLEMGVWIDDPQLGSLALRSELNVNLLRALRAADIELAVPQREITLKTTTPIAPGLSL